MRHKQTEKRICPCRKQTDSTKQRPPPQTRTGTGTAERLNQGAEQNTVMMGQIKGNVPQSDPNLKPPLITPSLLRLGAQHTSLTL
ncbi:unnamed protein product [Boreogadus saida]